MVETFCDEKEEEEGLETLCEGEIGVEAGNALRE